MKKLFATLACSLLLAASFAGCGSSDNRAYKDGVYTGKSSVYTGDEEGNGNGYGEVTITVKGVGTATITVKAAPFEFYTGAELKVTITVKDNAITACEFKTYEENGTLKGDDYGKIDGEIKNQDYYNKAQKAIKGSEEYAKRIIGKINPADVDSISGATFSYNQFVDAVNDALDKAAE